MVLSIVYGTVPEKCTARSFLQKADPRLFFSSALSGYVNNLWINAFTAQVSMSVAAYLGIGLAVLAVIISCVLIKAWRIANENPVKSIKSE